MTDNEIRKKAIKTTTYIILGVIVSLVILYGLFALLGEAIMCVILLSLAIVWFIYTSVCSYYSENRYR